MDAGGPETSGYDYVSRQLTAAVSATARNHPNEPWWQVTTARSD